MASDTSSYLRALSADSREAAEAYSEEEQAAGLKQASSTSSGVSSGPIQMNLSDWWDQTNARIAKLEQNQQNLHERLNTLEKKQTRRRGGRRKRKTTKTRKRKINKH